MRRRSPFAGLAAACVVAATLVVHPGATAATLPTGFADTTVAALPAPTAIAFTPDGRMLASTQGGELRVYQNDALVGTAINLSSKLCSNSERGLLGIAVDPLFASNGYVFLFYSFRQNATCDSGTVNRVSRFVMTGNTLGSETVLIDNIPSPAGNHNAGDLNFGNDGFLYVTTGDGGCDYAGGGCAGNNDAARDQHALVGKILRITRDGGIPATNPFQGAGTARCNVAGVVSAGLKCQETFAWGLRNPFRFAFDPNSAGVSFRINDVGQNAWEEIDQGASGADYGWNVREGFCVNGSTTNCGAPPAGMTNPIFAYGRADGCVSITGGAFVPNGTWGAAYDGKYLFADYGCGKIFRLDPNGSGGFTRTDFVTGLGSSSAVHLEFGPAPSGGRALYYTSYAGGGQIHRVTFAAANGTPTADVTASPTTGNAPLTVNFNGSGSSDPEGSALTYLWDFGDGQSATTTTPTTSHTYGAGTFTASLRVRDPQNATSAPDSVTITAGSVTNTPPSPAITSPASGSTFFVGQTITLTGSATDAQDGTLPASALSWEVLRHHAAHTHPWFSGTGNNLTFQAPAPEDLAATNNSFLEVRLTARDSGGMTATVSRNVQPKKVNLNFYTSPSGLRVQINGQSFTAPFALTSWQGWQIELFAPSPQGSWRFYQWSDRRPQRHTITTPAASASYVARFKRR